MLINSGYWNYYLAFRIKDYAKHIEEIKRKNNFSGMLAYITDDTVLTNKEEFAKFTTKVKSVAKVKDNLFGAKKKLSAVESSEAKKLSTETIGLIKSCNEFKLSEYLSDEKTTEFLEKLNSDYSKMNNEMEKISRSDKEI